MSLNQIIRSCTAALALLVLTASPAPAGNDVADFVAPFAGETVNLYAGRSQPIRAPWAIKGASLTDPAVANVEVATPEMMLVSGKKAGITDLIFWNEQGETRELRIQVMVDLERLGTKLDLMFPGSDIQLDQANGAVIVSGRLSDAEQAEQVHRYLEMYEIPFVDNSRMPGVQQVEVQVRLAEVSRKGVRAIGVNFFKTGDDFFGGSTIGSSGGGPVNPISIGVPLGGTATGDTPFTFTSPVVTSPSVTFFAGFPNSDLQMFVEALVENEYLRILAEPTLVALSGEEANFLAGGEFPIPVVQGGSVSGSSITIEYKEFGIKLGFRPLSLGEGRIRLRVAAEVSDLSQIGSVELQGFSVPSLVQRTAETTLELQSGQSFAMAGLLNESTNARTSRVPLLGDLPVLGTLFRSVRYQRGETELVIMVTASLVEPLSTDTFPPLPGSDHVIPSDWEFFAEGRIEGRPPTAASRRDAEHLRDLGLDRLRGPGAWAEHGQPMAVSTARSAGQQSGLTGWQGPLAPRPVVSEAAGSVRDEPVTVEPVAAPVSAVIVDEPSVEPAPAEALPAEVAQAPMVHPAVYEVVDVTPVSAASHGVVEAPFAPLMATTFRAALERMRRGLVFATPARVETPDADETPAASATPTGPAGPPAGWPEDEPWMPVSRSDEDAASAADR